MGQFLTHVRGAANQPSNSLSNNPLLSNSLAKLREYHGSFKSVCDTFSIDLTEFEQIFGANEDAFQVWDTDGNGLIDALELFCGLILFSDAKFDEKIRFLFDLFDFNELNSLSLIDLEFMFISCCNATYKIFGSNAEVVEDEISTFLGNFYTEDSRINISQLLKWCSHLQEIYDFFSIIRKDLPLSKVHTGVSITGRTVYEKFSQKKKEQVKNKSFEPKSIGHVINSKKYFQKVDWLSNLCKKIFLPPGKKSVNLKDVSIKMNWVYGFRCHDVRKSVEYIGPSGGNNATEKLIYFTACIVVVYYPKLNEQFHYLEHEKEVISIAVAKNLNLVASGELGENPAIHVWNPNTLQSIGIIRSIHQNGVHLLTFLSNNEYLVSCGIRYDSPILIHNLKDFTLVLSTYITTLAIDLFTISNYVGDVHLNMYKDTKQFQEISKTFVVCSESNIIQFTLTKGHFVSSETTIEENEISSPIKCATALRVNSVNPELKAYSNTKDEIILIITGHKNGQVLVWESLELREELANYKHEILNIVTSDFGVVIATDAASLHLWDLTFTQNFRNIDLTTFPFKLFNFNICDLIVADEKLLVTTTGGDVMEVFIKQKQESNASTLVPKLKAQRLNFITKLSGNMMALALLEKEIEDRILFVAGDSSVVYGFSLDNHEIIDIWSVGESITALDCINFEDGGTVFAVGCANGKIFLRIDWEEFPKNYECGKQIFDLKFSSDTLYLVAACEDSNVYVFVLNNNNYFQLPPKRLRFDGEIPVSLTFTDENKSFLVGTSMRNQYKIELPELKSKNLMQENELINVTIWNVRYPMNTKSYANSLSPLVVGGELRAYIGAEESGYICFWKDREQLETNCGGFLKGHSSPISRILMARGQDVFFTTGLSDNTMIEWKS